MYSIFRCLTPRRKHGQHDRFIYTIPVHTRSLPWLPYLAVVSRYSCILCIAVFFFFFLPFAHLNFARFSFCLPLIPLNKISFWALSIAPASSCQKIVLSLVKKLSLVRVSPMPGCKKGCSGALKNMANLGRRRTGLMGRQRLHSGSTTTAFFCDYLPHQREILSDFAGNLSVQYTQLDTDVRTYIHMYVTYIHTHASVCPYPSPSVTICAGTIKSIPHLLNVVDTCFYRHYIG